MGDNQIRMADIAEKLGVSVVTVSKALSHKEGVGAELKAKILRTASEMGYQKKKTPAPEPGSQLTIGVILAEHYLFPEHSFYWALYLKVTEALKANGHYCLLEIIKDHSRIPDCVEDRKVSGMMVLGGIGEDYLRKLRGTGLPVVLLDFYHPGVEVSAVIADSFLGGFYLTQHLIDMGHTAIGYLGSVDIHMHAQDMYYGFCKAHRKNGIPLREDWVIPDREGLGFRDEFDLPADLPTAFVCSCDQSAYHFARDLTAKGLRIPQDVSITGFYDHVYATLVTPQLTTYRINLGDMAAQAVDALLRLMDKKVLRVPRHAIIPGSLVCRESVLDRRGAAQA